MDNEKEVQEALDRLFNKLIEEVQKKNGVLLVDEIGKREIFLMLQAIAELIFEVMAQDIGIVIVRRK